MDQILSWLAPILSTLVVCAGQLALNAQFKRADEKREKARIDTKAKHEAEAQWRDDVISRLDDQDGRIDTILKAQCSQTRSDIIHKCHRYIDDMGCASTEEKEALHEEHEEYSAICEANDIVNHFVDNLVQQVMDLPPRNIDNDSDK